jgi:hypothetical protein
MAWQRKEYIHIFIGGPRGILSFMVRKPYKSCMIRGKHVCKNIAAIEEVRI